MHTRRCIIAFLLYSTTNTHGYRISGVRCRLLTHGAGGTPGTHQPCKLIPTLIGARLDRNYTETDYLGSDCRLVAILAHKIWGKHGRRAAIGPAGAAAARYLLCAVCGSGRGASGSVGGVGRGAMERKPSVATSSCFDESTRACWLRVIWASAEQR